MAFRSLRAVSNPLRALAASRSAIVPAARAVPRTVTLVAPRLAVGAARAFSFTPRVLGSGESKDFSFENLGWIPPSSDLNF